MEPIIRAGETYPLASDMTEADGLDYWYGPEDEIFVVEEGDEILGTYHLRPKKGTFCCKPCRRIRNDWPLVVAALLVLSPLAPWAR